MSDCPLCNEDEVCPGEHCLVELADVTAYLRTVAEEWSERPVASTPEVMKMQRFAGRMLSTVAVDLEKKYRPATQQAGKAER